MILLFYSEWVKNKGPTPQKLPNISISPVDADNDCNDGTKNGKNILIDVGTHSGADWKVIPLPEGVVGVNNTPQVKR